ncbi:MAG: hypothetical protein ACD_73C00084G0004 [uncultured bacterium]|nr:MAG: hypothetical protein ACD_73C00084G0004 [uncultured bacterium]
MSRHHNYQQIKDEKRLVKIMFIVAISGILISLFLTYLL